MQTAKLLSPPFSTSSSKVYGSLPFIVTEFGSIRFAKMMDRFSDTGSVVEELSKELQQDTDSRLVNEIIRNHQLLMDMCKRRDNELKDTLRALSANVGQLEQTAKDPPALRVMEQKEQLLRKKSHVESAVRSLEQEVQARKTQLTLTETTHRELDVQKFKLEDGAGKQVPAVKNALKLLTTVTNVLWDYDSKDVRGTCCLLNTKQVRPFSYKPDELTRSDVANAIWETLWQDQIPVSPLPATAGTRFA